VTVAHLSFLRQDFATKEAPNLHCATKDDVRVMAARVAAVNGTSKAAGRERRVADRRSLLIAP
jgi:hypothetical protein